MSDPTDEEIEPQEEDGDEPVPVTLVGGDELVPEPVTLVVDDGYLGSLTNL